VQLAALETLARFPEPAVGDLLLERWASFGPQMRSETIEALFSRPEWLAALLDAAETERFNLAHIDSLRVEQLRTHSDESIRNRATNLFEARLDRGDRQRALDAYQAVLTIDGDAARGRTVFAENCAQCHRVGGLGNDVGPDLASVSQAGRDKLLVNILDPSREINPQYTQYLVETADWQTHTGIIANETATSVTLKRAHGETETILRVNIESIASSNLSLMPEGWEEGIDPHAMADLLTFLTSIE
jgi:putative heme-binding domain-containing protein